MRKPITATYIKSKKFWTVLALLAVTLTDVAVMVAMAFGRFSGLFYILPAVLVGLDLVFFVAIAVSNFRFAYSRTIPTIVETVKLLGVIAFFVWYLAIYGKVFIHPVISALWGIAHVVATICWALFAAYNGVKKPAHARRLYRGTAVTSLGVCLLTAVFVIVAGVTGVFGQGLSDYQYQDGISLYDYSERTVVYAYDVTDNVYIVNSVLAGKGSTTVIPTAFHGIKVARIDCALFTDPSLTRVELQCAPDVTFVNLDALNQRNEDMVITADARLTDALRQTAYCTALQQPNEMAVACVDFANAITPNVAEGQIYHTFDYDLESLQFLQELDATRTELPIMHTWVGNKGDTFSAAEHAKKEFGEGENSPYDYMQHQDPKKEGDLQWNYQNNNRRIATFEEGENGKISAAFERVYEVTLGVGNDTKYSDTGLVRNFGNTAHRYVRATDLVGILEKTRSRVGFTLKWQYSTRAGEREDLDLTQMADVLRNNWAEGFTVYPVWTLNDPTLAYDGTAFTATYGDNVDFAPVTVTRPNTNITIRYTWTYVNKSQVLVNDAVLDADNVITLTRTNVKPHGVADTTIQDDEGTYLLTVTAGNDSVTSLTSRPVTLRYTLQVNKHPISFVWDTAASEIYTAYDHTVVGHYVAANVINDDVIELQYTNQVHRNVGTYGVEVALSGTCSDLYEWVEGVNTLQYTIEPYALELAWGNNSFVYNRTQQLPTAVATGLGEDELAPLLSIEGAIQDVGTGMAQATLDNDNYRLTNARLAFTIAPKEVTLSWANEVDSFEYDATVHSLSASVVGVEAGDIVDLSYSGFGTNAGDYTMRAVLNNAPNYTFPADYDNGCGYTVTRKDVWLNWQDTTTFVYDGLKKDIRVDSVTGLVEGGTGIDFRYQVSEVDNAVNVSNYTMEALLPEVCNYRYGSGETGLQSFSIIRRPITVTAVNKQKTYDGAAFDGAYTFTTENVATTDSIEEILSVSYLGAAMTAIDAGAYDIEMEYTGGDKIGNYSVTLVTGTLTVQKRKLSVHASAAQKTYDGEVYTGFEYTYNDEEVASTDTISQVLTVAYDGEAVTAFHAGNYGIQPILGSEGSKFANYDVTYVPALLTIAKKEVTLSWPDAAGRTFVYDRTEKGITATIQGLVAGDEPTLRYVKDADCVNVKAGYGITAYLNNDGNDYTIAVDTQSSSFDITPKTVTLLWDNAVDTFVYDAKVHSLTADVNGVEEGDSILLSYTGAGTDASSYTMAAVMVNAPNYTFPAEYDNTCGFTITRKPITLTWQDTTSFTYDGTSKTIVVAQTNGLVDGGTGVTYTYEGSGIDVDTYTVTASLPEVCNYRYDIDAGETGQHTFSIVRRPITVTAVDKSKIYDGHVFDGDYTFTAANVAATDTIDEILAISYKGAAMGAINVSDYDIDMSYEGKTKIGNYDVTLVSGTLSINKRVLTISANAAEKIYDGAAYVGFDYSYDDADVADTDTISQIVSINYSGDAISAIHVGNFGLSPVISGTGAKYDNYQVLLVDAILTINKKTVTLAWPDAAGRTFVYDRTEKSITATIQGLVGEDEPTLRYVRAEAQCVDVKNGYRITAYLNADGDDYVIDVETQSSTFNITPKVVSLQWQDSKSMVYNGSSQGLTAEIVGLIDPDTVALTYTGYAVEVGVSHVTTATLPAKCNYIFAESQTSGSCGFSITKRTITVTADDKTKVYNGAVYSMDNFTVSVDNLPLADRLSEILEPEYSGLAVISVDAGQYTISLSVDTTGKAKAKNYVVECADGKLTITPKPIGVTWQSVTSFVYDGHEHAIAATPQNVVSGDPTPALLYKVTVDGDEVSAINVGTYTMNVEVDTTKTINYTITGNVSCDFNVTRRNITIKADDQTKVYDGAVFPNVSYTASVTGQYGLADTDSLDEIVSLVYAGPAAAAKTVGTYNIAVSGSGEAKYANYRINYDIGKLSITHKEVAVTWQETKTFAYDATVHSLTAYVATYVAGDEPILSISGSRKDVGTVPVRASLPQGSNYVLAEDTIEVTLEITPAGVTLVWDDVKSFVYDGQAHVISATLSGLYSGDSVSLLFSDGTDGGAINVGDYTMTATLPDSCINYRIGGTQTSGTCGFSITQRALTVTADDQSKVYDGQVFDAGSYTVSADNLAVGDSLVDVVTVAYQGAAMAAVNVGDYTIGVKLGEKGAKWGNYNISYASGSLSITHKVLSLTWSQPNSFVYDGTEHAMTGNLNGLVEGESLSLSYTGNGEVVVGDYSTTAKLPLGCNYIFDNDTDSVTCSYYITKRPIELKADDKTKVYDGAIYGGGYTVSVTQAEGTYALAETDTLDQVLTLVYGGNAMAAVNAGEYTIAITRDATKAKYANYSITYVSGTLSITPKALALTWTDEEDRTFLYDGKTHGLSATFNDALLVGEDSVTVLYANNTGVDAGSYEVTATSDNGNYQLTNDTCTYTITARELTITASHIEKKYGNNDSFFYFADLVSGDDMEEVAVLMPVGDVDATDVGEYTYNFAEIDYEQEGIAVPAKRGNYTLTFVGSAFEIVQRDLTLTWSDNDHSHFTYDGQEHGISAIPADILEGDVVTLSYVGNGGINADSYHVTASIVDNANYYLKNPTSDYLIARRDLNIAWPASEGRTFVYDGQAHGITVTYDETDIVAGDVVNFNYTGNGEVDVGSYDVSLSIDNDNYVVLGTESSYTITARALTISADTIRRYYDGGTYHGYTYTADNLADGDKLLDVILLRSTGDTDKINVGEYTYCFAEVDYAELGKDIPAKHDNYSFTFVPGDYIILQRILTVNWQAELDLVYTGASQGITGVAVLVSGIMQVGDVVQPNFSGAAVEVGEYVMTATLAEDGNFCFAEGALTQTCTYYITPATLTVTWPVDDEYVYDGDAKLHLPEVSDALGEDTVTVSYNYYVIIDDEEVALDEDVYPTAVGEYVVYAQCDNDNYVLSAVSSTYSIVEE